MNFRNILRNTRMIEPKAESLERTNAHTKRAHAARKFPRRRAPWFDFASVPASEGVYGIHPYPAMFHFRVIRNLISKYSQPGDWLFDPFMGSGVAAVESLIAGRNFIGFDINPLACLIARVRCRPLSERELLETLGHIIGKCASVRADKVHFDNIDYWFDEQTIERLSKLKFAIFSIGKDDLLDFFKLAFSETVRRASRTVYSEFKLLRRKGRDRNLKVIDIFKEVSLRYIKHLVEFYRANSVKDVRLVLKNTNILNEPVEAYPQADFIVTSPPYGDSRTTVAYGQFSRLSLRWLGIDEHVDKTSLGSKRCSIEDAVPSLNLSDCLDKISQRDTKRAEQVYSYYADLYSAIKIIAQKLKSGGVVCFVVGNRRVKGIDLPTDLIVAELFADQGLQHITTLVRRISNKRMPAKNSPTNIAGVSQPTMRFEYIVILRKPR